MPNSINRVTGTDNITELWKGNFDSKFEQLYNIIFHYDVTYSYDIFVTVDEIESVIGHLDKNKSCGLDGVYAEHLMYYKTQVLTILAMCRGRQC